MARGKFVAIEAMDAAGKQTQSKLLAEKLGALLISFPRYGTAIGQAIRAHLEQRWFVQPVPGASYMDFVNTDPLVRQALFTLDRYDAAPVLVGADAHRRAEEARLQILGRVG
jgi:thymidylate kinase